MGVEPTQPFGYWLLRPARLPFRHSRVFPLPVARRRLPVARCPLPVALPRPSVQALSPCPLPQARQRRNLSVAWFTSAAYGYATPHPQRLLHLPGAVRSRHTWRIFCNLRAE